VDTRTIEYLTLLGYLYLRHGQAAQAVVALEAARVFRRDDRQLDRSLAYAYLSAKRFADCLAFVDRLRIRDDRQMTLMRSRALLGLGRQDEARAAVAAISGSLRSSDGG
jgi:predicted Zn-dependent protease